MGKGSVRPQSFARNPYYFYLHVLFCISNKFYRALPLRIYKVETPKDNTFFGATSLTWYDSLVHLFQLINFMSHLVPVGTPGPLIPFMVLIETVRNIIRPGTLSIRLAANIVAGHLLLTLLGSQGDLSLFLLCLMVALFLLLLLEVGVACIQAYVFTVLRSLYLSETISKQFNISQS